MKHPTRSSLEKFRVKRGPLASNARYGNNGAFLIRCPETKRSLLVIVSDQGGWEHASVSIMASEPADQTPSWNEMVYVKNFFWEPAECVVQYHPPKNEYVNIYPGALHLWKPIDQEIPMPPLEFV